MAAALPLLWLLALALHLARPYMLRTTQKFSLRLGADIWWVLYIGLRDIVMVLVAVLSFMYLYPDVVVNDALPISGSLATVAIFAALLVKLVADTDDDPRAFKLLSTLLGAGSALYIVPTVVGVQLAAVGTGPVWTNLAKALVTHTDQGVAVALCWISVAAIAVMGLVALTYDFRTPAHKRGSRAHRGVAGA